MKNGQFEVALKVKAKHGRLQEFIEQMGWTETEFAKRIGVHQATANSWFSMRTFPGKKFRLKICELLQETEEVLFPQSLNNPAFLKRRKTATVYRELDMIALPESQMNALPAPAENNPERIVAREEILDRLSAMLQTLTPREEAVLTLRFGLDGKGERTWEEIGNYLGVTRERPRQIVAKALRRLRHPHRAKHFSGAKED